MKHYFSISTLLILALLMSSTSCRTIESEHESANRKGPLPEVQVNTLNPLLADLSAFDLTGNGLLTKAGSGPDIVTVPLESLLDREHSSSVEGEGGTWIQTPILDAESSLVFLSKEMSTDYDSSQSSGIRKYLIDSPYEYFIATMIPYYIFSEGDWSYFDKRDFFGIVLLSSLEGELLEVHRYHPAGYSRALPVANPGEYDKSEIEFINIKGGIMTRAGEEMDGGTLDASICVAEWSWNPNIPGGNKTTSLKDDTGEQNGGGRNSGGGGGGSKTRTPQKYKLTLDIQGNGSVIGGGEYEAGIQVNVKAQPSDDSNFAYWTGYLKGSDLWKTIRMPAENISATAVFLPEGTDKPCYDAESGTYFPLAGKNKIAPTEKGKPAKSGTYGNVRNGGTRPHRGWDILATQGTPFFCPVEGKIANFMRTWVPNGRTDEGGCGNRIGVEFNLGGHQYVVFFLHLAFTDKTNPEDPANGIGINPRTGRLWAIGDTVHPGEMLGHTGDTGLAYKVTYKHLHIQIHNITESWPTKDSGWENYEDPSILFGDILEKDANGEVVGFNVNNGCDEILDSENAYNFFADDWRVSFGMYGNLYPSN